MEAPGSSAIRIVSAEEYGQLGVAGVQAVLRSKHILITGLPRGQYAFDETGLKSIGPVRKATTIHGKSFLNSSILLILAIGLSGRLVGSC